MTKHASDLDVLLASLDVALESERADIERETSTKAYMKGYVQGWIRAEKHHKMLPPESMAQLLKFVDGI